MGGVFRSGCVLQREIRQGIPVDLAGGVGQFSAPNE